ncbi:MAG: hypothetical protein GX758_02710 [Tenericutes bacterium]|nr:hypothetical protein [Mycoplasmatota bacterium]
MNNYKKQSKELSSEDFEKILLDVMEFLFKERDLEDKTIEDFINDEKHLHEIFNFYLKYLVCKTEVASEIRRNTFQKAYLIKLLNLRSNIEAFLKYDYYRVAEITSELNEESNETLQELKRNKETIKIVQKALQKLKGHYIPQSLPPLDELTDLILKNQINIDDYLSQKNDILTYEIRGITYIPAGDIVLNSKKEKSKEIENRILKLGLSKKK